MSVGFTAVKDTDCLSLLLLFPHQSTLNNEVHLVGIPYVVDVLARSHPVKEDCLAIMDHRKFLLNVLELLGNTRIHWMNKDSSSIENYFDTSKQQRSIFFQEERHIDRRIKTTDLGFGLAFATGFPVLVDESISH